jgi:hypothetical protein
MVLGFQGGGRSVLQSCHENAATLPGEIVTSDQFQVFEVVLKKRRRTWLWVVSTTDGNAVIEGSESSRPAASYHANRALFLLLLSAPYRTSSAHHFRGRKPLDRPVP